MSLYELADYARGIPQRLVVAESRLRYLAEVMVDVQMYLSKLASRLKEPEPAGTFVYLLPPEPAFPMACQRAVVAPGARVQLPFETYDPVPRGIWVVVSGPANVHGVKIGNCYQQSMNDYNGHVCKTAEVWNPGVRLIVELEA